MEEIRKRVHEALDNAADTVIRELSAKVHAYECVLRGISESCIVERGER